MAQVIQVIKTNLTRRGKGVQGDPVRIIEQYWSFEGQLLWEIDPFKGDDEKCEFIDARTRTRDCAIADF